MNKIDITPVFHKRMYVWNAITLLFQNGASAIKLGDVEAALNVLIDGIINEVKQ